MKFSSFFDNKHTSDKIGVDSATEAEEIEENLVESFDVKRFILSTIKPKYTVEMYFGIEFTFFNPLDKRTDLERIISTLKNNNIEYRIDKEAKHLLCLY